MYFLLVTILFVSVISSESLASQAASSPPRQKILTGKKLQEEMKNAEQRRKDREIYQTNIMPLVKEIVLTVLKPFNDGLEKNISSLDKKLNKKLGENISANDLIKSFWFSNENAIADKLHFALKKNYFDNKADWQKSAAITLATNKLHDHFHIGQTPRDIYEQINENIKRKLAEKENLLAFFDPSEELIQGKKYAPLKHR